MLSYFLRRLVGLVPMFFVASFISFTIIQLPPGDFVTTQIAQMTAIGDSGSLARAELLREQYGLNDPFLVRYWSWVSGILVGDFGVSAMFEGADVATLIFDGFFFTLLFGGISLALAWGLAIAIGIYSATHRYGIADYMCDRIMVMYLGRLVEVASKEDLYSRPKHPYTAALISSMPDVNSKPGARREILQGQIPDPANPPSGCRFHTRCKFATDICRTEIPELTKAKNSETLVACHLADDL